MTQEQQIKVSAIVEKWRKFDATIQGKRTVIKLVNGGRNGLYIYSAIIKVENKYYWSESVRCNTPQEKKQIDFTTKLLTMELNDYSMNKYINN